MRVGIVADDLTGAMDAAAPFADRDRRTRILLTVGAGVSQAAAAGQPSVLAIDTHSRDAAPAEAAAAVSAATGALAFAGLLPFKKIDSTLRGNLGAEIAAAMEASGRRCAVVAPAAPAQGRVLRAGSLLVHGAPVAGPALPELLRATLPGWQVRSVPADALQELGAAGDPTVYVADADDDAGLDRIAALGLARCPDVLLAGSSGLAAAVARLVCAGAPVPPEEQPTYRRLWFVVGSYHACSARQVRALRPHAPTTIVVPPSGQLPAVDAQHRAAALGVVHVEGLDAAPMQNPAQVAARLARVAEQLVADAGEGDTALFLTGGDTARAVLARMEVDAIDVHGSRYPGVIHGRAVLRGRPVGIVTKSGGFGPPDLFVQAARDLLRARQP